MTMVPGIHGRPDVPVPGQLRREIAWLYLRVWAVRLLVVGVTLLGWYLQQWWGVLAVVVGMSLAMLSSYRAALRDVATMRRSEPPRQEETP
jgi:hypothetical protein